MKLKTNIKAGEVKEIKCSHGEWHPVLVDLNGKVVTNAPPPC